VAGGANRPPHLPIIAIPMLVIAFAIKLTSPGPVIFKQQRYGIKGEKIG